MKSTRAILSFIILGCLLLSVGSCGKRQHSCAAYDTVQQEDLNQ